MSGVYLSTWELIFPDKDNLINLLRVLLQVWGSLGTQKFSTCYCWDPLYAEIDMKKSIHLAKDYPEQL